MISLSREGWEIIDLLQLTIPSQDGYWVQYEPNLEGTEVMS